MGEEFKDFEAEAPVLTLEPDLTDEKDEVTAKEPEKTEKHGNRGTGAFPTGAEDGG